MWTMAQGLITSIYSGTNDNNSMRKMLSPVALDAGTRLGTQGIENVIVQSNKLDEVDSLQQALELLGLQKKMVPTSLE